MAIRGVLKKDKAMETLMDNLLWGNVGGNREGIISCHALHCFNTCPDPQIKRARAVIMKYYRCIKISENLQMANKLINTL